MRRILLLSCLLWIGSLATAAETQIPVGGIQVEDGDTVLIPIQGEPQRIQLAFIDAPESVDNPKLQRDLGRTGLERERLLTLGHAASVYLGRLLEQGAPWTLRYQPGKRDRYGRLFGDLQDQAGISLSDAMVRDGYARLLGRGAVPAERRSSLTAVQEQAAAAGKGLWELDAEATRAWAGR